jgi:hypothetical protein
MRGCRKGSDPFSLHRRCNLLRVIESVIPPWWYRRGWQVVFTATFGCSVMTLIRGAVCKVQPPVPWVNFPRAEGAVHETSYHVLLCRCSCLGSHPCFGSVACHRAPRPSHDSRRSADPGGKIFQPGARDGICKAGTKQRTKEEAGQHIQNFRTERERHPKWSWRRQRFEIA